jgi:hypothetical protein
MTEKLDFITDIKGIDESVLDKFNKAGIETIGDIDPMDADDIVDNVKGIDHTTAFKIIKNVEEHKAQIKGEKLKSKSVNVNETEDLDIEDDVSDTEEDFLEDIENEEAIDKYTDNRNTTDTNEKSQTESKGEDSLLRRILRLFIKDDK